MQRLYNALTSLHDSQNIPHDVPPSPTAFASFPAGPGNAKPMAENGFRNNEMREFTSYRVATKDRVFTNAAKYKGMTYKIGRLRDEHWLNMTDTLQITGDYVHIANPEDPSRPIPAQVYRSFIPSGSVSAQMVS